MIDFVRTLFGIRKKRAPFPTTQTPGIGTKIVRQKLEIKIEQPLPDELWDWMLLSGWRVNPVKKDRRRYVRLGNDALRPLLTASNDSRARVHAQLINRGSRRG